MMVFLNRLKNDHLSLFRYVIGFTLLFFYSGTPHIVENFNATWRPLGIFKLLDGPISESTIEILTLIWPIVIILFILGLFINVSSKILFILCMFKFGYFLCFDDTYLSHGFYVFVMSIGLLSVSALRTQCTMDSFIFKSKQFFYILKPEQGIIMIKLYLVYMWVLVGLQKIYHGGFKWIFSSSLANFAFTQPEEISVISKYLLAHYPNFYIIFSLLGVSLELLAPLSLYRYRIGLFFAFTWTFFHFVVTALFKMHYSFYSQIPIYFTFVLFPNLKVNELWNFSSNKYSEEFRQ